MASFPAAGTVRRGYARSAPERANLGALVPVLCPCAILAVVLVGIGRNILVPDTWVALVSGREIARHGLPVADHLTVFAHGHSWTDQQWLAQLVLYAAEQAGGLGLMVALCVIAVVIAFGLAARIAQERGASPVAVLAFFILAFLAGPWGAQARTQALALPLFSLILWLLLRDPDARKLSTLWALPALCLWANIHGSVVLGAAAVCVYGFQALLRLGLRWRAAALALLSPVAVFASPYAVQLPGYYRLMLFHPPFGRQIEEWQQTTPSSTTAVFFAFATAALLLVLFRRRQVTLLDCLLLALTLAAALSAIRLIPWFALAALAIVPPLVTPGGLVSRFSGVGAAILALLGAVGVVAAGAWASAQPYQTSSHTRGLELIREKARQHLVFADLTLADWLLWKIPELRGRIAYDGRPELLSRHQFDGVVAFARQEPGWQEAVRGYGLVVTNGAIANRMIQTPAWRQLYADPSFVVLRRTAAASS